MRGDVLSSGRGLSLTRTQPSASPPYRSLSPHASLEGADMRVDDDRAPPPLLSAGSDSEDSDDDDGCSSSSISISSPRPSSINECGRYPEGETWQRRAAAAYAALRPSPDAVLIDDPRRPVKPALCVSTAQLQHTDTAAWTQLRLIARAFAAILKEGTRAPSIHLSQLEMMKVPGSKTSAFDLKGAERAHYLHHVAMAVCAIDVYAFYQGLNLTESSIVALFNAVNNPGHACKAPPSVVAPPVAPACPAPAAPGDAAVVSSTSVKKAPPITDLEYQMAVDVCRKTHKCDVDDRDVACNITIGKLYMCLLNRQFSTGESEGLALGQIGARRGRGRAPRNAFEQDDDEVTTLSLTGGRLTTQSIVARNSKAITTVQELFSRIACYLNGLVVASCISRAGGDAPLRAPLGVTPPTAALSAWLPCLADGGSVYELCPPSCAQLKRELEEGSMACRWDLAMANRQWNLLVSDLQYSYENTHAPISLGRAFEVATANLRRRNEEAYVLGSGGGPLAGVGSLYPPPVGAFPTAPPRGELPPRAPGGNHDSATACPNFSTCVRGVLCPYNHNVERAGRLAAKAVAARRGAGKRLRNDGGGDGKRLKNDGPPGAPPTGGQGAGRGGHGNYRDDRRDDKRDRR